MFDDNQVATEQDVLEYIEFLLHGVSQGSLELKEFSMEIIDQTTQKFIFAIGPRKV